MQLRVTPRGIPDDRSRATLKRGPSLSFGLGIA
jgi:hypothetical protein